ncbi:MAG TPA: aspartate kinase [Polyangiaceae bacterium]|jgi:aspartate kinase|nr:MAG: Aspartokinase [Deltaproteobacteria bacterium ADurb.Bin207]HNS97597.1 aspartate kinase [Polyangiaceae bacterium]HNZ25311.1 aspartate kinase [Polyangiaceae bacterium]HOD24525.1 aspartate kinase [Polyangiaceae bacterium]HOE50402.1 aspartate kinase [Polyangiaceae bacterium]
MAIIVQKYGGSSVADVGKIKRVADKIVDTFHAGNQVVVVVSAMAKATDSLLELAYQAAAVDGKSSAPARRELDMLVTTGERVSMALLSLAIQARGCDAISFTGSQCGILTNDRHFDARIIEVRPHRVEDELARGKIVIVAGYQGVSYKREITTLGRGGSDTTAVALAAALGADRCEIYSDVDGVYSADPRAVPNAKHIPELNPELLQEMAESGAKVLNAQAVEWARKNGIAIYARSTFDPCTPDGQPRRETIVRQFAPQNDNRVRAITCEKNIALIRLSTNDTLSFRAATAHLRQFDIPVRELSLSDHGGSFLIPLNNVPEWEQIQPRLIRDTPWKQATIDNEVAVVSVVGHGLTESAEPMARMVEALEKTNVPLLELRGSSLRLGATVAANHAITAQQALHRAFVEES